MMPEKKIEIKMEASQEMRTAATETTRRDTGTTQDAVVNRPSSTLSPTELEYALARPA